jgi:antibiotic biosynthesis monooxygenase (ABM) superfamily enzyme
MYPPFKQFETRRRELQCELQTLRQANRAEREAGRSRSHAGPPRYKLALLTWIGAYSLITAFLALLGPTMASWPLALRTLVLSATMVAVLTWLIMPRLTRLFRPWLASSS